MLVHVDRCACKSLFGPRGNVFSVDMALRVTVGVVVFVDALAAATSVVVAALRVTVGVVVFVDALAVATSVVVALLLVVVLVFRVLLVAALLAVYTFRRVGEAAAPFVGASASLRNRHWCIYFSALRRCASRMWIKLWSDSKASNAKLGPDTERIDGS